MRKFRMEVGGGGLSLLPAPVADAGLLAVPHRLDGPRPADGDLPGALHEVPAGPRPGRDRRPQGVGLHGRRRDGRARVAGRDLDGRPRAPRQPDLRHQLQPAAPRRPGARQRQDHPGARDQLPRRRLERHQGDLGLALGPAARRRPRGPPARAHERGARRRLPDLQVAQRRLRARALLRRQAGAARDGRRHERRGDLGAQPRRPRPAQGLRRLQGGVRAPRAADRDPRQDDQGLRDGRGRRGPEHHPPAEEDERAGAARVPRPLRARAHRRAGQATSRFYKPPEHSPEAEFIRERRAALGGSLPGPPAQGASRCRRRS